MSALYAPYPNTAPDTSEPILVEIDARMVPVLISATERYKSRSFWNTDADWQYGVLALNRVQEAILTGTQTLVDAVDRLYRLMDTALNGAAYTSSPNPADPARPIVSPEIPAAPAMDAPTAPAALRAQLRRLHQLAENAATGAQFGQNSAMLGTVGLDYNGSWRARLEAVQGEINEGWFGIGGQPATLADLVNALRVGSGDDTTRITDAIDAIAGDSMLAQGSQAANIFGVVKGLFEDVAGATGEGAILGTLIASSIATSGMLGVLASKIDQLLTALNTANTQSDQVETLLTDVRTMLS